MDWAEVSKHLKASLDPAAIKPPPQGKFGEYVDGLHVIREANRIFGFDGWSYTVERLEQTHMQVHTLKGRDGPYEQLRCAFLCAVRVNVDGVIREGLAVGVGNGKPENAGDVIESAVKEAETDALKRALRTFGNTFGLALYDKDKANREVASPPIPFDATKTRDRIKAAIAAAADQSKLDALWSHAATKDAVSKLTEAMQGELQAAYSNRMGEVAA
jgi:DNA recombination protein Rad52